MSRFLIYALTAIAAVSEISCSDGRSQRMLEALEKDDSFVNPWPEAFNVCDTICRWYAREVAMVKIDCLYSYMNSNEQLAAGAEDKRNFLMEYLDESSL